MLSWILVVVVVTILCGLFLSVVKDDEDTYRGMENYFDRNINMAWGNKD